MKPNFPFSNLDNNVANEVWSYTNIWDATDSVPSISQDMYLYYSNGRTFDDPNGWHAWNNNYESGYLHWYPLIGNPVGNQLQIVSGTYWLKTGMNIP